MADDFDPATVTWVLSPRDLDHLVEAVRVADEVVADLETTGLDEHSVYGGKTNRGFPARIVLAAFTLPTEGDGGVPDTWVLPLSHPDGPWLGQWRKAMRRVAVEMADKPWINANVKFDARWVFAHVGVDLSHAISWDTKVSSHLLDENSSTKLKVRAPETFGVPPWNDFDLSVPGAAERVPLADLAMYAARDTYWTWRLAQLHREQMFLAGDDSQSEPIGPEEIEAARLGRLAVWCAMPMVATLTAVEQRGMRLDVEWVRHQLDLHRQSAQGVTDELSGRYEGMKIEDASFAPTSLWFRAWAERAVAAGELRVAELTPTGKPRWSKGILVRQSRAGSEVARLLLAQRDHSKKAEFLASWLGYVTPEGYIHTTYNAGSVVTGRLSSDSPNLQQVTESLRPAFVPGPGKVFVDLDYCLAPGTRVLTTALEWVAIEKVEPGQELVGFPESTGFGRGQGKTGHVYERAEVQQTSRLTRPCYRITTSWGEVTASAEHRWAGRRQGQGARQWLVTGDLQPGDTISTFVHPREPELTHESGWLAGFLDGEGWVDRTGSVGFGQKPGSVLDRAVEILRKAGFHPYRNSISKVSGVEQWRFRSTEGIEVLSWCRPLRLWALTERFWEGRRTWRKSLSPATVLSVDYLGEQEVIALTTSTGTFIAEGLLSHNSQIEMRIAAFVSRCEPMLEAFRRGEDLHRLLAANITGKALADVLPSERQAGKSANFGLLYGMSAHGFREYAEDVYGVTLTAEEAVQVHRAYFATWDGIKAWHARAISRAHSTGQIISPIGRVRRVPSIHGADDSLVAYAERVAINSPIQGFASDLMQMAAASIEGTLPGVPPVAGAAIVATVHDDIVVEVDEDRWKEIGLECQRRMLTIDETLAHLDCVLDVPLAASAKVGTRWGLSDVGFLE